MTAVVMQYQREKTFQRFVCSATLTLGAVSARSKLSRQLQKLRLPLHTGQPEAVAAASGVAHVTVNSCRRYRGRKVGESQVNERCFFFFSGGSTAFIAATSGRALVAVAGVNSRGRTFLTASTLFSTSNFSVRPPRKVLFSGSTAALESAAGSEADVEEKVVSLAIAAGGRGASEKTLCAHSFEGRAGKENLTGILLPATSTRTTGRLGRKGVGEDAEEATVRGKSTTVKDIMTLVGVATGQAEADVVAGGAATPLPPQRHQWGDDGGSLKETETSPLNAGRLSVSPSAVRGGGEERKRDATAASTPNVDDKELQQPTQSYLACLQQLYALRPPQKVHLDGLRLVATALGSPHEHYDIIHVAGTNGKGSTCAKLAACLSLKGYRVGLYTSPHLLCLRERIRVDNEMIEENELVSLYNRVALTCEQLQVSLSYFEMMTQIAFLYFSQREVDWAVIETGLGGRLDATNIISNPRCNVVVSIGWDHTEILGATLEKIAEEKAGIIKSKAPVVLGPSAAEYAAFTTKADALGCEVWEVKAEPRGEDFADENARIARAVVEHVLRLDLLPNQMEAALSVELPLRAQVLTKLDLQHASELCGVAAVAAGERGVEANSGRGGKEEEEVLQRRGQGVRGVSPSPPLLEMPTPHAVVVDVGHNLTSFNRLLQFVQHHFFGVPVRVVVALSHGRHASILQPFISHLSFPTNNRLLGLHITEPEHCRAKPLVEWLEELHTSDDVSAALRNAVMSGLAEYQESLQQQQQQEAVQQQPRGGATAAASSDTKRGGDTQQKQQGRYALARQHARISPSIQRFHNYIDICGPGTLPEILRFAYRAAAAEHSVLLVAGTFFMTREVINTLGFLQGPTDPVDMNERAMPPVMTDMSQEFSLEAGSVR